MPFFFPLTISSSNLSHDGAEDDLVCFYSHQGRLGAPGGGHRKLAAVAVALVEVAVVVLVVAVVGAGGRVVVEPGGLRAVGVEPSRHPHPHIQQLHVLPHHLPELSAVPLIFRRRQCWERERWGLGGAMVEERSDSSLI